MRHPVSEATVRGAPLARAATRAAGAGIGDRLAGLREVAATVVKAGTMRGRDPLRRLRARLQNEPQELARVETEVAARVRSAVETAADAGGTA